MDFHVPNSLAHLLICVWDFINQLHLLFQFEKMWTLRLLLLWFLRLIVMSPPNLILWFRLYSLGPCLEFGMFWTSTSTFTTNRYLTFLVYLLFLSDLTFYLVSCVWVSYLAWGLHSTPTLWLYAVKRHLILKALGKWRLNPVWNLRYLDSLLLIFWVGGIVAFNFLSLYILIFFFYNLEKYYSGSSLLCFSCCQWLCGDCLLGTKNLSISSDSDSLSVWLHYTNGYFDMDV